MSVVLRPRLLRTRYAGAPDALGKFSFIIHGNSPRHHWEGVGCLSIKSFSGGEALYNVGHGRFRVDPNSYLILNQSQPYEITVDAEDAFESFCLFFEDGFAEEVHYSLTTPEPKLLDNPLPVQSGLAAPVCFFEKTYPHDDVLSPALFRF